jgi:hypothetical protein
MMMGRRAIRAGMAEMLSSFEAEYFVTLNANGAKTYEGMRTALKGWHARVDKRLLGGSWQRKAAEQRTQFIGCVEHVHSNIHWHLLLKLGAGAEAERFEAVADGCWQKLIRSGSSCVQKLATAEDMGRTARYMTKELWQQKAYDGFVLSGEFIN